MLNKEININNSAPTSVKKQLWEKSYLIYFIFDGQYYYIDTRQESPFGYEYDLWQDNGEAGIQNRIHDNELVNQVIKYIKRKRKLHRILGKID